MSDLDPIDEWADILDSRDIIARIEYLEGVQSDADEDCGEEDCEAEPLTEDETAELVALKALAEEGEQYAADWIHGETLIRESYFVTYAQELADDICDMSNASAWPFNHIDWEAAATDLRQDYSEIEFNGVTYLVR